MAQSNPHAESDPAEQTAPLARRQLATALRPVEDQARQTLRAAEKTFERAEETLTKLLVDGAYASVGATDAALAFLRSLPDAATRLRTSRREDLTVALEREFDRLSGRGRDVVATVAQSSTTRRALEQTRAARRQVRRVRWQTERAAQDAAQTVADDDAQQ